MNPEARRSAAQESKESSPRTQIVEVDFVRHGESTYKQRKTLPEERVSDLTETGKEQIERLGYELAETIDPENEIVVLWTSPAWRAEESLGIIARILVEKQIPVARQQTIPLMRNIREYDVEHMDQVWQDAAASGIGGDRTLTRHPDFQVKNDKFESYPEITRRAEGVYNWIRYITEHIDTNGKKLRIIGVSHMEVLEPVMEQLFGFDIDKGEGFERGEVMKITFTHHQDGVTSGMDISGDFRGKHQDNIKFDTENRKFIVPEAQGS